MTLKFYDSIIIHPVIVTEEIVIWYASIPDIIKTLLPRLNYNDYKTRLNEQFTLKEFSYSVFNEAEIKTANRFKAMKKQMEWMAGRFLIKKMIHFNYLPDLALNKISLSYEEQGAPFVTGYPEIQLSLSHSHDFTAAVCSTQPDLSLGLDLEKIPLKLDQGFLKTAFTQNEINHMKTDEPSIIRSWTAKEAYLKYIKKGFNESLHRVEIISDRIFHNKKEVGARLFSIQIETGYYLSLVYPLPA